MLKKKIGIYSAVIWLVLSSCFYVDNIVHYPKSYIEYFNISFLFSCFNTEEDTDRKEEALDYAKAHGKGVEGELLLAHGFKFLKPSFSLLGYLKLVCAPIVFLWLILLFI